MSLRRITQLLLILLIAASLWPRYYALSDLNLEKIISIFLVLLGTLIIFYRGRIAILPGSIPMTVFIVLPLLVHEYVEFGWVAGWALSFIIFQYSVKKEEAITIQKIARFIIFFLFLVISFQIFMTGDTHFLRNLDIFLPDYFDNSLIHNPNLFSRTVIMLLPLAHLQSKLRLKKLNFDLFVLIFSFFSVAFIAVSKSNIAALLVFYTILFLYPFNLRKVIQNGLKILFSVLLLFIVLYNFSPIMARQINRVNILIRQTYNAVTDKSVDISKKAARTKVWALSLKLISENLWLGVGAEGNQMIADMGAVKVNKITKEQANIAVHGGILRVLVARGLLGLFLFIGVIFSLARYFWMSARNGNPVGKYGLAFLFSTLMSQIGANIYAQWLFWVVLGILCSMCRPSAYRNPRMNLA